MGLAYVIYLYIYIHWGGFRGECRHICQSHGWMVWVIRVLKSAALISYIEVPKIYEEHMWDV